MANPEHVEILKQGVGVWNEWRRENPDVDPDIKSGLFKNLILKGINFSRMDLTNTLFQGVNLEGANFKKTMLTRSSFLNSTILNANFTSAQIYYCHFMATALNGVNFSKSTLLGVNFQDTKFSSTYFLSSSLGRCVFANVKFIDTIGLEEVIHLAPSTVGIETILKSNDQIPTSFLRSCGVPEDFIKLIPSLTAQPIQYYSCFISYSSKDDDFAHRLYNDLQGQGVRCWFAPEDMKIGDRIRPRIDQSIRLHDKLLLILSEQSIASQWVEKEVETAFEKERRNPGKTVLFPIMVDGAVMDSDEAWAADIRRTRHIGDFSNWTDYDSYQKAFDRLMRDLKASEE